MAVKKLHGKGRNSKFISGVHTAITLPAVAFIVLLTVLTAGDAASGSEAGILFKASSFTPVPGDSVPGWTTWSQRSETRPGFFTAEVPNLGGPGSLGISGASNSSAHGCWVREIEGIQPGNYYRIEAFFRTLSVPWPRRQVLARLNWLGADGKRVHWPEYVQDEPGTGPWHKVSGTYMAPKEVVSVEIELYLSYCPQGKVWWDKISLRQVPDPGPRMVRLATVNCDPRDRDTALEGLEEFCKLVDEAGRAGCDIVCLGEGVNLVGVSSKGVKYPDIAEPVPGPTTEKLGRLAAKHGMYIVAALGEREGHAVYNTAVLIDRQGRVAGRYRKVMLPREEIEAGVTPGNSLPVFDTDFGRIGMMVCWDSEFPLPAQTLAMQGAEVILLPIAGGDPILVPARAIENQVYLVSSAYNMIPSAVYNPKGKIIAEAREKFSVAWADVDLNKPVFHEWVGNLRHRLFKERRADIKIPAFRP